MLFHSSLRQELMRTFSATLVVLVTVAVYWLLWPVKAGKVVRP